MIIKIKHILKHSNFMGLLLIAMALVSLIIANTALGTSLENALSYQFFSAVDFRYFVNEILMSFFFLLVGLEIKREFSAGELSSLKQASLPIFAAIGGTIVPAILYIIFNYGLETEKGWAITLATDIAFSLTIIAMLKNIIPTGIRILLASLAVVDDILGILVIALFYSKNIDILSLILAFLVICLMSILNKKKVAATWVYMLGGAFIWYFFHAGGIHATLSGVVTAMLIPNSIKKGSKILYPLHNLEKSLTIPVGLLVMPIFAFVNTNIFIEPSFFIQPDVNLFLGIFLGLVVGKPLGIFMTSYLVVKLNIAELGKNINWGHILGVGCIAGIGFTVSIFIAILSFDDNIRILNEAKIYILIASISAALLGILVLYLNKHSIKNSSK